eukprot:GHVU01151913.1.p1 GENE.GHVU01151913.1~~GHVU01151913.1.p1  ORF type:complete len:284 (+),score=33.39 GHVU01151913.1:100-951(+)
MPLKKSKKKKGSGKAGSGKKKKLTKAEKDKIKLDKLAGDFRRSGAQFASFLDRMHEWLLENHNRISQLLTKLDTDSSGMVTFDEFKSAMFDLNVPCNGVELHLLGQLLDTDGNQKIVYEKIKDGLKHVRAVEETYRDEEVNPPLPLTRRNLDHCPCCNMAVWDGEPYKRDIPRYVEVLFRFVTFDEFTKHPGHFNKVVHSHINVKGLMEIIAKETSILTTQMALFLDKKRDPSSMLTINQNLEDIGLKGGPRDCPSELLIYYDYKVEFTDCPILMCDHYFVKN